MPGCAHFVRSLVLRLALLRLFLAFAPAGILDGTSLLNTIRHVGHGDRKLHSTTAIVIIWETALLLLFAFLLVIVPSTEVAPAQVKAPAEAPSRREVNNNSQGNSPYAATCAAKVALVMRLAEARDDAGGEWELIVDRGDEVRVWKSRILAFRYRLQGIVSATPAACYDAVNDVSRRHEWDEMTEVGRVVRELEPGLRLQHVQLRAVWPASARDLLIISHSTSIASPQAGASPTLITAGWSVENEAPGLRDAVPVRAGSIRMSAECVGLVCRRLPDLQDTPRTLVTQIADGDPRGWLPTSLVSLIATKKMPDSFVRVARLAMRNAMQEKSIFFDVNGVARRAKAHAVQGNELGQEIVPPQQEIAAEDGAREGNADTMPLITVLKHLVKTHGGVKVSMSAIATIATVYLVFGTVRRRVSSRNSVT